MTHVGFLGTGHIAAPMARALATRRHSVIVSRRNESVSTTLVVYTIHTSGCNLR